MNLLSLTKEEKKLLDEKHEADMKIALQRRSGALERGVILSEVTGRPADWHMEAHHILGRNKPKGFKSLHPTIQKFWPHVVPACMYLTTAEHQHAAKNSKMMIPLLLRWMLTEYLEEVWQGRAYWEWLSEPPYEEYL